MQNYNDCDMMNKRGERAVRVIKGAGEAEDARFKRRAAVAAGSRQGFKRGEEEQPGDEETAAARLSAR